MCETKTLPTVEEILGWLPERTSLYYVDYRDSLDNSLEEIQECIKANNWDLLNEKVDDWYHESVWDAKKEYRKDLRKHIQTYYGLEKQVAKDLIEKYEDDINNAIYDRCNDDVIKDLLRNTTKESIYYDTGFELEADSWSWSKKEIDKEVRAIKKVLKIKDNKNDDNIFEIIQQASYGGQLVIYFRVPYSELITETAEDFNTVTFTNFTLAIINTGNGSGGSMDLDDVTITLPFNRNNLFIDKLDNYSYVYEVCGMCADWCDRTEAIFSFNKLKERKRKIEDSATAAVRERDTERDRVYRAGNCTPGDMNISRHRDTYYRNDYPCGTKCPHCGTFWID
jgi:hypothetical protein